MRRALLSAALLALSLTGVQAQRVTDMLDRGLIAQKTTGGVFLSWRILGEEYYDVKYNVYRDGVKITDEPLDVSNYKDAGGTISSTYTVSAVVRGKEEAQSGAVTPWQSSYKEITLTHEGIASTLIPNDACCADVDGDGELEILMKFDNESEMAQSYPKNGPTVNGKVTGEYSIFEILKQDGKRLWWVNCGPNMGDFQNNEQNIVGYDWNCDGKAEVIMRLEEGSSIHMADGTTYTIGADGKNGTSWTNYRGATGGGVNWFMHDGKEFLVYCDGETGQINDIIAYPLARLEPGETSLEAAWGDGYGHRSSKFFFGAPYLDGKKPSIFLARGIYTQIKMCAYDVDPASNKLQKRWDWRQNNGGYWMWQGYHNFGVADVDWDGRDEIVYGSMVIDDNGKGLSTTGLGHGDAQHCGDFNPYIHGQEIYACNEDQPGNNYRDATTSKIYHRFESGNDDGRAMAGNFCNDYPGGQGCSAREGLISLVYNNAVPNMNAGGVNTNFRIYWDGDLLEETFNYRNGKNTEGVVAKYGSWEPIYTCAGSMTNNDTKGTPCYQGDIFGDWREEIIMRTANNNIRIYSTPTPTQWRNYTLWHDHQYRNAMVWQMCGYNQPPHVSYFLGQLEKITVAPPPLTINGRTEVANGGTIGSALNDQHVIYCHQDNGTVAIEDGAKPYILTFNVPTWVQGTAGTNYTAKDATIKYETYTCDVTGGGIAGEARLIKQGDGILNLPKADFAHTGETNIWAGTLNFDGTMKNSPLWLNRFAELNSNGGAFKSIKADYASVIRPGGEDAVGTIDAGEELNLGFGSRVIIDITADGNDNIKAKTLKIEKKTGEAWTKYGPEYIQPIIEIHGESLIAGDYVIFEADSVNGSATNIKIEGDIASFKTGLRYEDGKVILTLGDTRGASAIEWTGANSNVWNFADAENFVVSSDETATPDVFVVGDVVEFNDKASKFAVSITGDLAPGGIVVNNSKDYTFSGTGAITSGSLTKDGTGTLTINNTNTYTDGNFLKGGTVKVSSLANEINPAGNLGGVITNSANFTMENGAVLQSTAAVTNGSPIKMVGDDGGVINNSADFVQQKALSGTLLTKKGNGWLKTSAANGSLSKLVIAQGTVDAAATAAKTVEIQGTGAAVGSGFLTTPIYVADKAKGALTTVNRATTKLSLTGTGQLTVYCATEKGSNWYATRTPIQLNLSKFEGTLVAGATYTADGRFTFDTQNGGDAWTLSIPTGIIVQNSGSKTLRIGALTGTGTLGGACAFSNGASPAANTWQVGGETDFKFEGKVTSSDKFEKVGSGKMTVAGAWDCTGSVTIKEGILHINSGATIGNGSLTVAMGATLEGMTKTKGSLTNSSYTVNGTLQPGLNTTSATGTIDFGGKNVTIGKTGRLVQGIRIASAGEGKASGANIANIGTLTVNGTIAPFLDKSYVPVEGDVIRLWTDVQTFAGTPEFELPERQEVATDDDVITYIITWDTSDIANGVIRVASVEQGASSIDAPQIADNEPVSVQVVASNGATVGIFDSTMSAVGTAFQRQALPAGIYILYIKNNAGVTTTQKQTKQ